MVAAPPPGSAVQAAPLRNVGLDADDRLDALVLRPGVELDRAEHVPMVREGHGGHAHGGDGVEDVVETVGAVEEAVLAVEMEMDEVGHRPFMLSDQDTDEGRSNRLIRNM
jgi:hypothetical protein